MANKRFKLRRPCYPQFTGNPDRDRIINLRRELKLSQQELANILNCNKVTVSGIENGYKPLGKTRNEKALLPRIEELEQKHGIIPPLVKKELPLNERILKIREALNLSQKELATYLGVSIPTVSRWENKETLTLRHSYSVLIKRLETKMRSKKLSKTPDIGRKRRLKLPKKAEGCDSVQRTLFDDLKEYPGNKD